MEKTGFCDVGCGGFLGVFLDYLFQANLLLNMLVTLYSTFFMKICWKKPSRKDRKFRSSNEEKTGFCQVFCGAGL